MQVNEDQVLAVLGTVTDFDRGADVVSLGMISDVNVEDGRVRFAIAVDPGDGASKEPLRAACERAVRALPGVAQVEAVIEGARSNGETAPAGSADELREQIVEVLKTVYDPEIPVDIYELGLIYAIDIDPDRNVRIEMTLTAPGCPVAGTMPLEVESRISMGVPGVGDVRVELVWDPPWTMDRMSEAARLELGFF